MSDLLGLADDPAPLEKRIAFFETPALALFEKGVILRARKIKHDGGDDVTVKVRGDLADQISADWDEKNGFKREIDRAGDRQQNSASLSRGISGGQIDRVTHDEKSPRRLFCEPHCELLESIGVVVPWDELLVLGPIHARTWKREASGMALTIERWELPEAMFLEVSTKVSLSEGDEAAQRLRTFLSDAGVS